MKIKVNQISSNGLMLEEEISPVALELETETIKFQGPVKVKAHISKITNAVSMDVALAARISTLCSRCLKETESDFKKKFKLNYQVNSLDQVIDIDPDIREEIILNYEMNPLCQPECKGLCVRCGKNLNEGDCGCRK